jgi:hypothetical protein
MNYFGVGLYSDDMGGVEKMQRGDAGVPRCRHAERHLAGSARIPVENPARLDRFKP